MEEAEPGKRQCMGGETTESVGRSFHAQPVPCLCLSLPAFSLSQYWLLPHLLECPKETCHSDGYGSMLSSELFMLTPPITITVQLVLNGLCTIVLATSLGASWAYKKLFWWDEFVLHLYLLVLSYSPMIRWLLPNKLLPYLKNLVMPLA